VSYTKQIALSDYIAIDGSDMSDCFDQFGLTSEDEQVDVSGYNATGADEFLQGKRTQSFTGEVFYTSEMYAILYPLYANRTVFELNWQPDGLADPSREVYYGNVSMLQFSPTTTRGDVAKFSVTFAAADAAGIVAAAAT
jgi:hypothetical protein